MASTIPRRATKSAERQNTKQTPTAKPLKRPVQARARFTVQAIYDAFVKLWRAHGWDVVTTRAVALETGISVGTLYEYFPNKESLLSGYFRHCIDCQIAAIEQQVVLATTLTWQQRIKELVRLTCSVDIAELPYFDSGMLMLENQVAEPKHHRRVYEKLSKQWIKALAVCDDLPHQPDPETVKSLYLSVWGARRYAMLVDPTDLPTDVWLVKMENLCIAALGGDGSPDSVAKIAEN